MAVGARICANVTLFSTIHTIDAVVVEMTAPTSLRMTGSGFAGTDLTATMSIVSEGSAWSLITIHTYVSARDLTPTAAATIEQAVTDRLGLGLDRLAHRFSPKACSR